MRKRTKYAISNEHELILVGILKQQLQHASNALPAGETQFPSGTTVFSPSAMWIDFEIATETIIEGVQAHRIFYKLTNKSNPMGLGLFVPRKPTPPPTQRETSRGKRVSVKF